MSAHIQITFPQLEAQWDVSDLREDQKVPPPRYRHAAPSAPWPWMDLDQDAARVLPLSPIVDGPPWSRYPQSHFGNWTPEQVGRCGMLTICKDQYACRIHKVDVLRDGQFDRSEGDANVRRIPSDPEAAKEYWDELQKPFDANLRVRAIFIENITLNVLQMLGASYSIEPFFFASSANWIPSRYQEDPQPMKGDHITVVLPFVRTNKYDGRNFSPLPSSDTQYPPEKMAVPLTDRKQTIDTQAPLVLSAQKILVQDLLAIHMVRNVKHNIIISYHHHSEQLQKTSARRLQALVQRTGDSVYWQKIYAKSKDPTFVFLAILWYALYAWDETLEAFYAHLSGELEATAATTQIQHTRELHKLQAHILYYEQLLTDFRKSVEFVRDTPNPAMDDDSISDFERDSSKELLELESGNLIAEIDRLEKQRLVQSDRLKNAMRLAFSTVNIEDNKAMKGLAQASLRDSAATKLISYLVLVFLPASYLSAVYGMNVVEFVPGTLGTLAVYAESTIVLTLVTAWIVIAWHEQSMFHPPKASMVKRVAWPVFYGYRLMNRLVVATKERLGRRRVNG